MQTLISSENIINLVKQMPPSEQIKVIARLSEGLVGAISEEETPVEAQRASPAEFVAWLRDSAVIPSQPTDSVRALREIREERLEIL